MPQFNYRNQISEWNGIFYPNSLFIKFHIKKSAMIHLPNYLPNILDFDLKVKDLWLERCPCHGRHDKKSSYTKSLPVAGFVLI